MIRSELEVFRRSVKRPENAVVIAREWPSWLFVLPGLGFDKVHVFISTLLCNKIDVALRSQFDFHDIHNLDDVKFIPDPVFFLAGPEDYIVERIREIGPSSPTWVAVEGHLRQHPRLGSKFRWSKVRHSRSGGATTSRSWIGQNVFDWWDHPPEVDPNRRCLRDVLSSTELGEGSEAPERLRQDRRVLTPDDLFPADGSATTVIAPSVFSSTKWTKRSLIDKELAILFDVPVSMQSLPWSELGRLFVTGVPSKTLWAATAFYRTDSDQAPLVDKEESKPASAALDKTSIGGGTTNSVDWSQTVASKHDDAETYTSMWDVRALSRLNIVDENDYFNGVKALNTMRKFLHCRWYRRIWNEIRSYLLEKYGEDCFKTGRRKRSNKFRLEMEVLRDCLYRSVNSDWWDWSSGSTLYFWRWTYEFQTGARDGIQVFRVDQGPRYRVPQQSESDAAKRALITKKLQKVLDRGYVRLGKVLSLTGYFAVDKAKGADIRMVYDGTKSGLNDSIWAPNFYVPSIDSLVGLIDSNSWMSDIDLGEFFLNFPLDESVQSLAGIDLTPYFPLPEAKINWKCWARCLMGFKPLPYNAVGTFRWADEIIRGNPKDPDNPFRWESVEMNLPGMLAFDPRRPWVSKRRKDDGCIANDFVDYIDDVRPCGNGVDGKAAEQETHLATRRIALVINYLGMQDAPRKRRPPLRKPGAWNGCMLETGDKGVLRRVSQERWDKTRTHIREIFNELQSSEFLDFKRLRSYRGFLVYVSRTYGFLVPYLKGIHLTLESWRTNRDEDGWGNPRDDDDGFMYDDRWEEMGDLKGAPETVKAVPRLQGDLNSLVDLTESEVPPVVRDRPSEYVWVEYGAGDASGGGLGSAFRKKSGVVVRAGLWGREMDGSSSNFRELYNLVDAVSKECEAGRLANAELFLFTDNSTAESAFYRGTSSSKRLFELVLKLRKVEMKYNMKVHMIHIPGTRMILLGVDGFSRGNMFEGVMNDPEKVLEDVPLHKSVGERSQEMIKWLCQTFGIKPEDVLEPADWFVRGHDVTGWHKRGVSPWFSEVKPSTFLWTPAPAAANYAVEQLRKARHRRQESTHVMVIPRLFTSLWRKQLYKVADVVFEIPAGCIDAWGKDQHEPLTVAIVFPFLKHRPWQSKGSPRFLALARELRSLWKTSPSDAGPFLREFCLAQRRLETMPKGVVWSVLQTASARRFSCRATKG